MLKCCINWRANHVKDFPNRARMAQQYLGVPATSATVERLFSAVGFEFADRRKSQSAETLANLAFAVSSICLIQNFNDGREAHMLMTFGSSLSTLCDLHAMR